MKTQHAIAIALAGAAIIGIGVVIAADGSLASGWKRGHHGDGPGRHGAMQMFERVDADADGTVTRAEADAFIQGQMASHDADANGTLSLEEFEGAWTEMMHQRMVRGFQRFDRDGDGQLSEEELNRPIDRAFSHADRNDDGAIEISELRRGGRHGWRDRDDDDDDN